MTDYLVISALGEDQPGIIDRLSEPAAAEGCNIMDTRMTVLGGDFALLMLISGEPDQLVRAQPKIEQSAQALNLITTFKPTRPKKSPTASQITYRVDVIALDNPGIVHDIAHFFSERRINIAEMHTGAYAAAHTGTAMFSLQMRVDIPSSLSIATLKEAFIEFCEQRNLDASIEADRSDASR